MMAIISHTFGSVKLTQDDAAKFTKQIRYGKPKAAAHKSAAAGSMLAAEFSKTGVLRIKIARAPR